MVQEDKPFQSSFSLIESVDPPWKHQFYHIIYKIQTLTDAGGCLAGVGYMFVDYVFRYFWFEKKNDNKLLSFTKDTDTHKSRARRLISLMNISLL